MRLRWARIKLWLGIPSGGRINPITARHFDSVTVWGAGKSELFGPQQCSLEGCSWMHPHYHVGDEEVVHLKGRWHRD